MRGYIIRRLIMMVPTMFLATLIVFFALRFIPGNVIDMMVAEMAGPSGLGTQLTAQYLRHALGLDVPVYVQYIRWLGHVIQGDLGNSGLPVPYYMK